MAIIIKRIPKPVQLIATDAALEELEQGDLLDGQDQSSLNTINASFAKIMRSKLSKEQTTGIEWTNHTWNPFVGCTVHTAGCTNCYAMKQAGNITAKHYDGTVKWVNGNTVWTGKLNQSPPHILNKPYKIAGNAMIFVNSMSDFFHKDAQYQWQLDAMKVMKDTPQHIYQILTKRPENIVYFVEKFGPFPDNVWVGITMERADYRWRIDTLRQVPAKIRFMSIEPLVGSAGEMDLTGIHWVIVGGESGPGARTMLVDWVREVRDQCVEQKVPLFFKQWGKPEFNPLYKYAKEQGLNPGSYINQFDPIGKGGCLVDGVEWKEFPATA